MGRIGVDWYATHVAVRLQDFFFATAPWQRRLWDAGTLFTLRELLEASRWQSENVLSPASVTWLAREVERIAGRDVGVGDSAVRRRLTDELRSNIPFDSRHWRALEQLMPTIEGNYLARWMAAVDAPQPPGAERTARALAAHLLDKGYSQTYLHGWVRSHLRDQHTLGELFADACRLADDVEARYEIILPFVRMPKPEIAQSQENWLTAGELTQWLDKYDVSRKARTEIRHVGGFRYEVQARDDWAAARTVVGIHDRLFARASYVSGFAKMAAAEITWLRQIDGPTRPVRSMPITKEHRGTYVKSLVRERNLHHVGTSATNLDDALELAAALNNSSSRGPALASGWSALESLLYGPGDPQDSKDGRGAVVCDRAAELVVCAWPRAELTSLAYAPTGHSAQPAVLVGDLARSVSLSSNPAGRDSAHAQLEANLETANSNLERCRLLLDAYALGTCGRLTGPSDIAAQERMLALVVNPRATLDEVRVHIQQAFRRMYRMRNIVVHGGAASTAGLDITLRTTAPLVGAALDRVAHAQLVDGVDALALAARANVRLGLVGTTTGVADLLT